MVECTVTAILSVVSGACTTSRTFLFAENNTAQNKTYLVFRRRKQRLITTTGRVLRFCSVTPCARSSTTRWRNRFARPRRAHARHSSLLLTPPRQWLPGSNLCRHTHANMYAHLFVYSFNRSSCWVYYCCALSRSYVHMQRKPRVEVPSVPVAKSTSRVANAARDRQPDQKLRRNR